MMIKRPEDALSAIRQEMDHQTWSEVVEYMSLLESLVKSKNNKLRELKYAQR